MHSLCVNYMGSHLWASTLWCSCALTVVSHVLTVVSRALTVVSRALTVVPRTACYCPMQYGQPPVGQYALVLLSGHLLEVMLKVMPRQLQIYCASLPLQVHPSCATQLVRALSGFICLPASFLCLSLSPSLFASVTLSGPSFTSQLPTQLITALSLSMALWFWFWLMLCTTQLVRAKQLLVNRRDSVSILLSGSGSGSDSYLASLFLSHALALSLASALL